LKYPLKIYGLITNNLMVSMNAQCQCSTNTTQFKIKADCEYVYFSGTEIADKQKTQIQVKYKQKTESLSLTIYQPEFPIELNAELGELNAIQNWHVPNINDENEENFNDLKYYLNTIGDYEMHRSDYDFDNTLDELAKLFCKLQYQTTRIRANAKFYSTNKHGFKNYLVSVTEDNKFEMPIYFDVTSLVRLKVDNQKYAYLNADGILNPISHGNTGNTNVQVKVRKPIILA
jgi:hypothetical protein